jgi:uncharacterized membrane protein (UPF0182 family)
MRRRGLPGLLLLGVILLLILPTAVDYYTDWLWFGELGYGSVFVRTLNAQSVVFAATFAAVFAFLYVNFAIARAAMTRPHVVLGTGADGRPIALEGRRLAGLGLWVALIAALLLALAASNSWLTWLNFFQATPFNERDPLFGRDVAFYVFRLPVFQMLRQEALTTSFLALIGCGIYYVLSGSFVVESKYGAGLWPRVRLIPRARRHMALLATLIFLLMAWGAWLEVPRTLLTPATVVFGASYADVHARLPFLRVELVVLLLAAGLAVWHGFGRRGWPIPAAVGLYLLVSIGGALYAGIVQAFVVTPNELDTEQPYIVHHIAATRRAYALDRVEELEHGGDAELTPEAIAANASTIENVRLWDHQPLLQTFAQIQEIRTYYDFINVDNDRYQIDGKYRQVMLSVRELNTDNLQNRSWINDHLQFTHGYGLTLGPVNQVTTEGLPVLFIRDIPPVSTVDLKVTEPSVYFGENSSNYVLVKTRQPEFHYPRNDKDKNETTVYSGTGGVPVGGFWRRLLFAIRFATTDILVTNQITPDSRIMFHRRIGDRARMIAPFLTFDFDPYPVVADGRIFWIQDAYTTTANYPYSKPTQTISGDINYIRNSVKVVTDAYNGSMTFYVAEPGDPLVVTLGRVFPGLLKPISEMPAALREHVRYPEEIFRYQAAVYATYHMKSPLVFYNKEDQWQLPSLDSGQTQTQMQPYYTVMRLPGEQQPEFIQMLPFTPRSKDNLAAWMVARSDSDNYGRLLVFQFPKQKIIYGPRQIVGRINQDQTISPQITLWNQQGSEVIWGTLLVIPIEQSMLYVRPLYLRSPQGRIPELKRVVVVYQAQAKSQIVMAETLTSALTQIFGRGIAAALPQDRLEGTKYDVAPVEGAPPPAATPEATTTPASAASGVDALIAEAIKHFDAGEKALRDGDLGAYREEMKKARALLEQAAKIRK